MTRVTRFTCSLECGHQIEWDDDPERPGADWPHVGRMAHCPECASDQEIVGIDPEQLEVMTETLSESLPYLIDAGLYGIVWQAGDEVTVFYDAAPEPTDTTSMASETPANITSPTTLPDSHLRKRHGKPRAQITPNRRAKTTASITTKTVRPASQPHLPNASLYPYLASALVGGLCRRALARATNWRGGWACGQWNTTFRPPKKMMTLLCERAPELK